jgi:hypothetical protein
MTKQVIDLGLHKKQLEAFKDPARRVLLVSGRRFGKSRVSLVRAFVKCMESGGSDSLSPPVILVAMPTLVMAKRVIWRPLIDLFKAIPGVEINTTERRIAVPGKFPIIVAGLENYDSIRGLRIAHCHIDEGQDIPFKVLTEILFPAMADTPESTMFVTGTPKGKSNWLYKAAYGGEFSFHNYPTLDNPFIPRDEVEKARALLPPNIFRQEFEASFVDFDGRLLVYNPDTMMAHGCIGTDTVAVGGVDWGDINPAYVIGQISGIGINPIMTIIEAKQLGDGRNPVPENELFDAIAIACRRHNVTRLFCDPSRPAAILSMRSYGTKFDVRGMAKAIKADNAIMPGISALNAGFNGGRLRISPNCQPLSDELINYHRVINRDGQYTDTVAPGQSDHMTDALRYCFFTFNNRNKFILTNGLQL